MVVSRWCGVLMVSIGLALLPGTVARAASGQAPSGSAPAVEVHIDSQAYQTERGTMTGSFRMRCTPGQEMTEVSVLFEQSGSSGPATPARPVACDGRWQRQRVTSPEHLFEGGPATMTVRAVVVPVAGGAAVTVTERKGVYVRPAAKIVLPATARLEPGGGVRVVLQARCDAPWVLQDFLVSGSQAAGSVFASTSVEIPCDGVTRTVPVVLRSDGAPLKRGPLDVAAEITLLDPDFFDPAAQVGASRAVRVR